MKKILIITTILISFFLLNENVSASSLIIEKNILDENTDTISGNFAQTYYDYYNQSSYKTKLENIINQIKSEYKYYYVGINGMAFWNDDDVEMYVGAISKSNINIIDNVFYNPNNAEIYEMYYFRYFYNKTIIYVTHTENIFIPTYAKMFMSLKSSNKSGIMSYSSSSDYVNYSYFSPSKYANINVKFNSNYLYQVYNSPDNYYETINIADTTYNTGNYIYKIKSGPSLKYKYLDIIDISKLNGNEEIEYRYYSNDPVEFYYTSYENGELPDGVGCITGTGIYECNVSHITDIQSNYSYYTTAKNSETDETVYIKRFAYDDSPAYSPRTYYYTSTEDLSKYPITCGDGSTPCWTNNYYRSFTIDLSLYVNNNSVYKSQYIYVYYNVELYEKSYNNETKENTSLEDFTEETIKPPSYEEETNIVTGLADTLLNPFIKIINKKFPIINQLGTIITSLSFEENEVIPDLTVDLSYLGMPGEFKIIDVNAYKEVREILFLFEYISICLIAVPKIIKNIKDSFGGAE